MKTNAKKTAHRLTKSACLPLMALMVAILSCSMGTQPTDYDKDAIIVRAYLSVGKPVNDVYLVHLTKALHDTIVQALKWDTVALKLDTFEKIDTIVADSTVDNAVVTISTGGVSYRLTFLDSGRYQDASGNLVVTPGQIYRIDIDADGRHVWAQTTVPSSVGGLTASRRTLYTDYFNNIDSCGPDGCKDRPFDSSSYVKPIDSSNVKPVDSSNVKPKEKGKVGKVTRMGSSALADSSYLTLKWNNPDHAYLYYRFALDTNLYYPMYFGGYTTADSLRVFCFTKQSSYEYNGKFDSLSIPLPPQLGRFKFTLYSTTQEYRNIISDMADTVHQDQWINSPTNINNGVGFFTAFSFDTISFSIVSTPKVN